MSRILGNPQSFPRKTSCNEFMQWIHAMTILLKINFGVPQRTFPRSLKGTWTPKNFCVILHSKILINRLQTFEFGKITCSREFWRRKFLAKKKWSRRLGRVWFDEICCQLNRNVGRGEVYITRGRINTLLSLTFSRLTFRDCKIYAKSKFRERKLPGQLRLKTPN